MFKKEWGCIQLTAPDCSFSLIPETASTFCLRTSCLPSLVVWSIHLDKVHSRPALTLTIFLQRLQEYHIPSVMSTSSQWGSVMGKSTNSRKRSTCFFGGTRIIPRWVMTLSGFLELRLNGLSFELAMASWHSGIEVECLVVKLLEVEFLVAKPETDSLKKITLE